MNERKNERLGSVPLFLTSPPCVALRCEGLDPIDNQRTVIQSLFVVVVVVVVVSLSNNQRLTDYCVSELN